MGWTGKHSLLFQEDCPVPLIDERFDVGLLFHNGGVIAKRRHQMPMKKGNDKEAREKEKEVKRKQREKDDAFWCDPSNYPFF